MALLHNGRCYVNKSVLTPRDSTQVHVSKSTSVIRVPYRNVHRMRDCVPEHNQLHYSSQRSHFPSLCEVFLLTPETEGRTPHLIN